MASAVRSRHPGQWAFLAALVLLLTASTVSLVGQADPDSFWNGTFQQATALSARDGRPVLLLFPDARLGTIHDALRDTLALGRAQKSLHLARVRSGEVEKLWEQFQLRKVPAVLLIDRHGAVLERWEGLLPLDLWGKIDRVSRKLDQAEKELIVALEKALSSMTREDFVSVLIAVGQVKRLAQPGHPSLPRARAMEVQVLEHAGADLTKVLAGEGVRSDSALAESLRELGDRYPHPSFQGQLDRESKRIKSRKIGG